MYQALCLLVDQADHDTATIRLWAEGSSFELLVHFDMQTYRFAFRGCSVGHTSQCPFNNKGSSTSPLISYLVAEDGLEPPT